MAATYDAGRKIYFLENIDRKAAMDIKEPITISPTTADTVYIGKVDGSANQFVVNIDSKCKAITISGAKKIGVVCTTVVARIELINCVSVQLQIQETCPIVQIDKTERTTIYLSQPCVDMGTQIFSAGCTGVNIMSPTADGEDQHENPIPEQFKSTVVNGKLVNVIVSE